MKAGQTKVGVMCLVVSMNFDFFLSFPVLITSKSQGKVLFSRMTIII